MMRPTHALRKVQSLPTRVAELLSQGDRPAGEVSVTAGSPAQPAVQGILRAAAKPEAWGACPDCRLVVRYIYLLYQCCA